MNHHYDLIVAGGGLTGVAAAIAAAREGLRVLLVEQYGFLGGAATNSQVNPFMPYTMTRNGEKEIVNKGIFLHILEGLEKLGGLHTNRATFNEELLKLLLDRMVSEHKVEVLFHSRLIDVERQENRIRTVTVANKSGKQTYAADYFLDATGDADLTALAGCPFHLGREQDSLCQPMTLCFRLANVDLTQFRKIRPTINPLYKQFQAEGKIKNPREDVLIFEHMSDGVLHFNSTRIIKRNPVDAQDVSIAEMQVREQVYELYQFLKGNIPGFEKSTLLMSAPQIGVRESRMIEGEYTITGDDLMSCTKFEDSIARGTYCIDIHSPDGSGTTIRHIPEGEYYTIPYRALIPRGMENLLTAGRCISSTHEAQSAYRVMPICCCMGEAAGAAVAVAAKEKLPVGKISVAKLQTLIQQSGGAI